MKAKIGNEARLNHIIDAINDIDSFTDGLSISDFLNSDIVKSATVRQLSIIGEAANHLSDDLKNKYKDTDWQEIVGFRNIIIHEYFIVDYGVVWSIITNDIHPLKLLITKILKNEFNK